MENFEKIEAYITGKMNAQEKETFEQSLQADPSLKGEVAMQKAIVESVKKARVAELKGMLSQVPVTGVEFTLGISVLKIAATIVSAGILVAASVFYFNQTENKTQVKTVKDSILDKIEIPATSLPTIAPGDEKKTEEPKVEKQESTSVSKPASEPTADTRKASPVVPPKIDVANPSDELTPEEKSSETVTMETRVISMSHIPVETENGNKKYSFHYQFSSGKLILFGAFDKGLYEVLEVNGNTHSLFLYYKDNFYLLNEKQKEITALTPITDPQLVSKLKGYRAK